MVLYPLRPRRWRGVLPLRAYSCLALNGWLLLFLGAVVPVWVLALLERRAWRRWQGRAPAGAAALAFNACGMALASAACLYLSQRAALAWA